MATFDVNSELNPGVWFDYPDDPDKARVKVRAHTVEFIEKVNRACTKLKPEYKQIGRGRKFQRFEVVTTDDDKMKEMLWDYAIVDWENFFDAKKNPLECTKENKVALMRKVTKFYNFIDKCVEILTPDVNQAVEEAEKN